MNLPSTDSYEVVVTADPEHESVMCYGVENKMHKVIEYYDNLLPRTYQAMVQMEEKYHEMEAAIEGGVQLELVGSDTDITSH